MFAQHSLNRIQSATKDSEGATINPTLFTAAEYRVFTDEHIELLKLTLGDGIAVDGDDLVITIQPEQATFAGEYNHQLVAFDQDGKPLPPTFLEKVTFQKVKKDVDS